MSLSRAGLSRKWHGWDSPVIGSRSFPRCVSSLGSLLLCLGGCGEQKASPTMARDSAGIAIVENEAPLHGGALSALLAERPLLDVGAADAPPEEQFEYIIGAVQTPDRGFVIADRGRRQLLFYDVSGNHRVTAGRAGQGPGEFQDIGALEVCGDSVLAYDWRQRRLSVFGLDGALIGTVQLASTPDERHPIQFYNLAGLLNGELLVVPWAIMPMGQEEPGPYWDSAAVYVYGVDGGVRREIGERYRTEMYVGTQGSSGRPFGARTSVATDGSRMFMGTGESFEVREYDAGGSLTRIIRRQWEPRLVTPAAIDSLLEHMIRGVGATSRTDPRARGVMRALESAPLPDHMPAFSALLTDARGNLWVRQYGAEYEDGAREWSVFDREGSWLGDVTTPERFETLAIGADVILGVWRDPLDVQHFQVYRLR
jgi:hypothetical protein